MIRLAEYGAKSKPGSNRYGFSIVMTIAGFCDVVAGFVTLVSFGLLACDLNYRWVFSDTYLKWSEWERNWR